MWELEPIGKTPPIKNAILVEGLPGIGNVGKIAVDFIIDQFKPKLIFDFYSTSLPHSVFVNKDSLVELPKIELYLLKRTKLPSLLLLSGDIQPVDEISSHEFVNAILEKAKKLGVKNVVTLGGIGLAHTPKKPKIYITGTDKKIVKKYSDTVTKANLVGVVGPIVGVTGLLLGLGQKKGIPGVAYLVESFAHPMHIGIKEAKELLKLLAKKLELDIDIKKYDKSIGQLGKEVSEKIKELQEIKRPSKETNYIG